MEGIISTIKQNCRRCYTCVRDCPAKAIRIEDGQASVVAERCISCGNCTKVCSQGAKAYSSGLEGTLAILDRETAAALVAPSFPVAFEIPPAQLMGALRQLGFTYVIEVAYGADLVNQACHEYLREHPTGIHIGSACPAVVEYVRKYHPELTDRIIPVVSPMAATALAAKERYGQDVRCVFIGPCVAKKAEILDSQMAGVVDEVLTFAELQRAFAARGIDPAAAPASDFDAPHAGLARIYPIPGGLLESAGIGQGILDSRLIVVSGKDETIEALAGLPEDAGDQTLLVEALMCNGCYSGPGVESTEPGTLRRRRVAEFAAGSLRRQDEGTLPPFEPDASSLCLSRRFEPNDQRSDGPTEEEIREILSRTNKFFPEDELNCGACGYPTCRAKAKAVYEGMAEETMCLPFIIDQSERVCDELNVPWNNLRDVHRHLINSEKLASMGQMAAGVAHELNNPLSTILLYAHILQRKLKDREDLDHDLKLMAEESDRCKKIIGNLLDFARQSRVRIETTPVEELVQTAVDGAVAGLPEGRDREIDIVVDITPGLEADLDRDQMTQVLVNIIKNALEAMEGRSGTVRVSAHRAPEADRIRFSVSDQGAGIPDGAKDKVFQPFFTTKSIGKGTGLGLPISYGIVKMHNGNIWFDSDPDAGTTFHVEIPASRSGGERSEK
ncbi:MAG: 4Fe-4S dicluster domain-containing protein [Thermoleophilia bacterium]|nr:4Fe-4S dicluster domain-containing protein [Thermoleophilia bacterium]